jgi:hypothetical protein
MRQTLEQREVRIVLHLAHQVANLQTRLNALNLQVAALQAQVDALSGPLSLSFDISYLLLKDLISQGQKLYYAVNASGTIGFVIDPGGTAYKRILTPPELADFTVNYITPALATKIISVSDGVAATLLGVTPPPG